MTQEYEKIKEKLKTIHTSQKTINFLNNFTNNLLSVGNIQLNNYFINKVFRGNDEIIIENRGNRKLYSNNIIINGEKIILRTTSMTNNNICIKHITPDEQVDFNESKRKINNILKNEIKYVLIIRTEEFYYYELDKLEVVYHYYLFPSDYFMIIEDEPIINEGSFSGAKWIFKDFKEFRGKYHLPDLYRHNICLPYISY